MSAAAEGRRGPVGETAARRLGLRGRSLAAMLIACVVAALPTSLIGWHVLENVREQLGLAYARDFVLLERERILAPVQREVALAQRLAGSTLTVDWLEDEADPAKRERFFREAEGYRRMLRDHSYFLVSAGSRGYYFNDPNQAVSSEPRFTVDEGAPKDAWFFATMAAPPAFNINVEEDLELHLTKVWINAVIADGTRRLGVAGTGLDLSGFVRDLIDSREPGVTAMLVDEKGAIQAHPDTGLIAYGSGAEGRSGTTVQSLVDDEAGRSAVAGALQAAAASPGRVQLLWAGIGGARRLLAIAHIPELHWHVVAAIDLGAARAVDLGLVVPAALVLLLLVLILAAGFGSVVDRIVLRPIRRLQQTATAIAAGRYDAALPPASADEIGDLTRAFATMSDTVRRHTAELEDRVRVRTAELERANAEMAAARRKIDDSIAYASLIQRSVLPQRELEALLGGDQFVIWQPRDVVGGDFWIVHREADGFLIGVFDCAGHGVAGALMTMLARSAIDDAVATLGPRDPAKLLAAVDQRLRQVLSDAQRSRGLAATADAGLAWVDPAAGRLLYSGARIPLYVGEEDRLGEIAAARRSLAGRRLAEFANQPVPLRAAQTFYLLSDGLLDQAGGERGFGFGTERLAELVAAEGRAPLERQRDALLAALARHQGTRPQTDDITVIGFRLA